MMEVRLVEVDGGKGVIFPDEIVEQCQIEDV